MQNFFNPFRRMFFKKMAMGGALSLGIPQIVAEAYAAAKPAKISLSKDDVILFQGDSITDAGRNQGSSEANQAKTLGTGYAFMAGSELLFRYPDKNLKVHNKGISGNKVYQLAERWEADAISLKPNVVSILIGVNDFWHTLTGNYTGTIQVYQKDLDALLERTKKQLPGVKLIIGEPFAVTGIKAVDAKWYPAFNEYRRAARTLADRHGAIFIPYQSVFDKAQKLAPGVYWTYDGVHPSVAGSQLMAHAWLEAVK
jgi:lysophospholipase L1-like esterase